MVERADHPGTESIATTRWTAFSRRTAAYLSLSLYLASVGLLFFEVIPFEQKFVVLVVDTLLLIAIAGASGVTWADLGVTRYRAWQSVRDVVPLTLAVVALALLALAFRGPDFTPTEGVGFFLFYVFVSCPAQELMFRGLVPTMTDALGGGEQWQVAASAALYSLVHIIYRDPLTVVGTLIVGWIWATLYLRTRNLAGVTASHVVLGVVTIALGLVD